MVIPGLLLLGGGFGAITFFLSSASPQSEIQTLLEKRASALSAKDLKNYLRCFSLHYQDGEQGYADLKDNASRWFTLFESIHFSFQIQRLEADANHALVENNYTFSLRAPDGEALNIRKKELLELVREQDGWKIFKTIRPH
ncbi:hypothetical protein CSB45_05630 [candidate division KSB3 bacterium]|uniref:DUF4440 domain-containing protein n=1 Tax=candidate division KSB3 bacterium TaxID=2044937 RepID=A0A2G6E768_9BACT|nr:MAG: hypothetical protein CSB45_05630 [candidate division KSB3 bacterium]PIE30135.1 MAG: hypothetical protein CSA57_04340 [candidate division KSB3 bacterium]